MSRTPGAPKAKFNLVHQFRLTLRFDDLAILAAIPACNGKIESFDHVHPNLDVVVSFPLARDAEGFADAVRLHFYEGGIA